MIDWLIQGRYEADFTVLAVAVGLLTAGGLALLARRAVTRRLQRADLPPAR